MKKIIMILFSLVILLGLIGCQQLQQEKQEEKKYYEDLPPTPRPPGQTAIGIGKAIGTAIPPWAAPAKKMEVEPKEIFPGNQVTLNLFEYQYIYQNAYIFNQKTQIWEKISLFGGERTDEWIKNSAATSFNADLNKFRYGDNYVVAYACNKLGKTWTCNNNKWMLTSFLLKEKPVNAKVPEKQITTEYVLATNIAPFQFQTAKTEEDNFGEIMVMRYDANYYEPKTRLKVIVRVFEFNNMQDLSKTMTTFFKDIINQGWKTHNNQNIALYLDMNNIRNTIWTSGNKLLFIETHSKEFASAEIINKYLQKYKSDLKRV